MAGLPDFSATDRSRLKELGVVDAQIEQLRYACLRVRLTISPPAARNDVNALLDGVAKLTHKLLRKTAAIERQISTAHATAHLLIEQGYWHARPDDEGGVSFHCVAPRLKALRDAACAGKKQLPSKPSRLRSASPQPVRAIYQALVHGWTKEHGSSVFEVYYENGKEVKTYTNEPNPKPYPDTFHASAADGSAFREIVGICYAAEGGNSDPVTAIKAYLKIEKEIRTESRAAIEAGIEAANKKQQRRTSPGK